MRTARVLIADAVPVVRERLSETVRELDGFEVVGLESSLDRFRHRLTTTRPDILLMGSRLADGSGFEALEAVATLPERLGVVLFSDQVDGHYLHRARVLGVDYLLECPRDLEFVPVLLRGMASGARAVCPDMALKDCQ